MNDIKCGDLVMVVKPSPCGCARRMGLTFTVVEVSENIGFCAGCKEVRQVADAKSEQGYYFELSRLIKIDPPAEDTTTEHKQEITA